MSNENQRFQAGEPIARPLLGYVSHASSRTAW